MRTTTFVLSLIFCLSTALAANTWVNLTPSEKADILHDLDYLSAERLPAGTKKIKLDPENVPWRYKILVEKVMKTVNREISREDIEQSPYETVGDESISGLYLLVNKTGLPLGGVIYLWQDGRYEEVDGSEDINWSSTMRFSSNGSPFEDENGAPVDELRFEWSGH